MEQQSLSIDLQNQRKYYIDIVRALAICFVVALHAYQRVPVCDEILLFLVQGVPLFLLISGGLIIERAEKLSISQFFKKYNKRLLQFTILIPICGIVTNALVWFCMGPDCSLNRANGINSLPELMNIGQISFGDALVKAATEANGVYPNVLDISNSHTWYLYLIISLYILTPFLAQTTRSASKKERLLLLLLILLATGGHFAFIEKLTSPFNFQSLIFFFMGYLIISSDLIPKGSLLSKIVIVGGVISVILFGFFLQKHITFIDNGLSMKIRLLILPIVIVLCIRDYCSKLYCKLIRSLSDCSFGIYLWHFSILWLISIFCQMPYVNSCLRFFCFFSFSLCVPWGVTIVMKKSKWTRWLVS